ncbi:MAG: ABC transporter permease [Deltaproteobacteria bacterium]|nr:ABC transporter permease [Deltaproteobacteria bacterium]
MVAPIAALALWALLAAVWSSPRLPGPLAVAIALAEAALNGPLWADLGASLSRVGRGWALAAAVGLPLGAAAALGGPLFGGLRLVAGALRPVPPIAWVPLAILWLGLGDHGATFIVAIGASAPIFAQASWGLARCPPQLLEMAHAVGAGRRQVLLGLRLPAALPALSAGLRTGLGVAWTSVIAAELLGAQSGLGYRIGALRLGLDVPGVIAHMLVIGAVGALMDRAVAVAEARLLRWPAGAA